MSKDNPDTNPDQVVEEETLPPISILTQVNSIRFKETMHALTRAALSTRITTTAIRHTILKTSQTTMVHKVDSQKTFSRQPALERSS